MCVQSAVDFLVLMGEAGVRRVTLTTQVDAPVNVAYGQGAHSIAEYASRGVARVSFGPMFQRHLWLSQVSTIRPPVGPGMLAGREYLLSALLGLGLGALETNTAALAITTYVDSAASLEAESQLVERATGQTNDAWWYERNDLWATYFDVDRHPAMTTIWHADGYQSTTREAAADAYRYGLDRLLDGIQP